MAKLGVRSAVTRKHFYGNSGPWICRVSLHCEVFVSRIRRAIMLCSVRRRDTHDVTYKPALHCEQFVVCCFRISWRLI